MKRRSRLLGLMACVLVLGACDGSDVTEEPAAQEDREVTEERVPLTPKAGVTLDGPECGLGNSACPGSSECFLLHLEAGVRGVCLEATSATVCGMFTCSQGTCSLLESLPPHVVCDP